MAPVRPMSIAFVLLLVVAAPGIRPTDAQGGTACSDGIDNDGDGKIDWASSGSTRDRGCFAASDTSEKGTIGCDNGVDDDGDGKTDFHVSAMVRDPGCSGHTDGTETGSKMCDNGFDDDADGRTDWRADPALGDPGCLSLSDDTEIGVGTCDDGIDNDMDGRLDHRVSVGPWDPGCADLADGDERGVPGGPECDDGVDNDFNGKADFWTDLNQADPGCVDAADPIECTEDAMEPNEASASASFLGAFGMTTRQWTLALCPNGLDWFKFTALETSNACADIVVDARVMFMHARGDLDADLYFGPGAALVDSSHTTSDTERVEHVIDDDCFSPGDNSSVMWVRVDGFAAARNTYTLQITVSE